MSVAGKKCAPRAAQRLLGHEVAERTFLEAWNAGRLHHAWLLAGPRGIGKATLAYRIARFVLAQGVVGGGLFGDATPAADLDISPDHPIARRVASGGHSDLLTVERSVNMRTGKLRGEIVVDDVRRLSSFLALTTGEGQWRAVVVDVADELNRSAANALLKGLEEPPPRTLFLLVSHMPGGLLPTIRSRCRKLALAPLPEAVVTDLLSEMQPELASDDARTLTRLAEGSIGQALVLAESGGLGLYRELVGLLSGLDRLDVHALHALGDRVGRTGAEDGFVLLGRLLDDWLSGMIRARARGSEPREVVPGEGAAARRLFARGSLAKWLEVWENVSRLFSQAGSANLDRKQVVVSAFLALEQAVRG